jgi:hypothetical protein
MIARRLPLALLVVASSACALESDERSHSLSTGPWIFRWAELRENSCFPLGVPVAPGVPIEVFVTQDGGSLAVNAPQEILALPAMSGTQDGDGRFTAEGSSVFVVTTNCALALTTRVSGVGLEPGLAAAVFDIAFAKVPGGDCSPFEGETVDGLPFPSLAGPDESCAVRVAGLATEDF